MHDGVHTDRDGHRKRRHLESRPVAVAGITIHPDEPWMRQIARNVTMEGCGALQDCRYLLHDQHETLGTSSCVAGNKVGHRIYDFAFSKFH